jgi:hypothetical protein
MDILRFIEEKKPFVFAKFGDGEYDAATRTWGTNGDGTLFTPKLQEYVIEAFKYLAQFPNVYIGKWEVPWVPEFFQKLTPHPVNWENYNIFIARNSTEFLTRTMPFYKAIRNSSCQKIYVCNETMVELSKKLLKIDDFATIHPTMWFEYGFEHALNYVISLIKDPNETIILTSAGMGAKPLIAGVHKKFPNITMLDIGSALDLICSGRRTRDFHILNENEIEHVREELLNSE